MTVIMGVDLGSTSAECVIVDGGGQIVSTSVVDSGTFSQAGMRRALDQAFADSGLSRADVDAVASTGYGRRLVPGGVDYVFTEVSAHARGVAALFPGVRLVVDIGGQDTKAIVVDEHGLVVRFAMNDRCAGGTGRAYEGLAQTLETDLASLGELALQGQAVLEVSSLCATFAVTEVISLLAKGQDPADIAASVHKASAYRTLGLIGQVGKGSPTALTGGVARNPAAVHHLSAVLGEDLLVPDDPKITGAYGAALLAFDARRGRLGDAKLEVLAEEPEGAPVPPGRTSLTLTGPSGRIL